MNAPEMPVSATVTLDHGFIAVFSDGSARLSESPGVAGDLVRAVLEHDAGGIRVDRGSVQLSRVGGGDGAPLNAVGPLGAQPVERPIAVDQTHRSIVVDEAFIVKIVTVLGGSDRAAHQLERLARSGSAAAPRYFGSVDWVREDGMRTSLAMVSQFVPGTDDGWTWAVDDVLAHLENGPSPAWPREVGRLTAQLHVDLHLSLRTEPCAAQEPDSEAPHAHESKLPAVTGLRQRAERALTAALMSVSGDAGARLKNRRGPLAEAIASLPETLDGAVLPIHGDLHVGQILRDATGERYWIIDFDGDPQLTDHERELADSATRDVAHMLTSIDLVAAVVQRRLGRREPQAFDWAASAQRDFLTAYRQTIGERGLTALLDGRLLDGYVAEQLLRELLYAGRFLPRWLYAADAVITARYPSSHERKELPWNPPVFSTT